MREVYINRKQADVNQSEAVDIIYESPIFSDISKIKSNTTTTYKLPKTDRNLAIFRNADQHDVVNNMAYEEWDFQEYRNGLPIIQNGKCRLLKIADSIELAVVWGTKVALSEKLNVKLNELEADKEEKDRLHCLWNIDFLKSEKDVYPKCGMIYADFGTHLGQYLLYQQMHPSVTVDQVFSLISEHTKMPIEYRNFEELFKKLWLPSITKKMNGETMTQNLIACNVYSRSSSNYIKFACMRNGMKQYFPFYSLDLEDIGGHSPSYAVLEKGKYRIKVSGTVKTGANYPFGLSSLNLFFSTDNSFKNGHKPNSANVKASYESKYAYGHTVRVSMDEIVELEEGQHIYMGIYHYMRLDNGERINYLDVGEGDNEMILNLSVSIVNTETVLPSTYFPIAKNLPDITCLDFIKTICAMYGLFPSYDFDKEKLELISINDIYRNKENAKCWDNKVIAKDWTIERTFGDYVQNNILNYAEDDTVSIKVKGSIIVENTALAIEKELITLKFAASEEKMLSTNYNYGSLAYIPIYAIKDGKYEYKSVKPRILREDVITKEEGKESINYRALRFDDSMKFGGASGLVNTYYNNYQKVVGRPVVRDVTVLLNEVELKTMSTLDVIYLRGKYWMPIKITVGIDGKATARLILLPEIV